MAQQAEQGGWDPASPDAAQLPTRKSIGQLSVRLALAEARRTALFQQGDRLLQEFRSRYPDAPAYLVRYADRTLNDYRWRLSGHTKWRRLGLPDNKAAVELTGEIGVKLLAGLPVPARQDWLRFEARRQAMNFESAMTKYEVLRLRSLIERQEMLRQLVRQGGG